MFQVCTAVGPNIEINTCVDIQNWFTCMGFQSINNGTTFKWHIRLHKASRQWRRQHFTLIARTRFGSLKHLKKPEPRKDSL